MRKAQTAATRKFYVSVGKKIAEARSKFPKTQQALAADLKVNRVTVVNIERGRQQLLLHTIVLIGRSLNVKPESLIPEFVSDEVAVKDFVANPGGAAWIESSLKTRGKTHGS